MSQRAENNYRLELYDELDGITTAMRNLAQVELVRLEKAHRHQQTLFANTHQAMTEFLHHYGQGDDGLPSDTAPDVTGPGVMLVLGSERGFCGGFNEQIARHFRQLQIDNNEQILVIGSRLASKLSGLCECIPLRAAVGIDESMPIMQAITDQVLQQGFPRRLRLLYHDRDEPRLVQLLPVPPTENSNATPTSLCINLPPNDLLQELQWHYLQQGLMLYLMTSLHTENRWRLQQMEGARDHLEELSLSLRQRINAQRQQQIVEEIEVILSDQTFE